MKNVVRPETTIDVDPYLVQAAPERLAEAGHHPRVEVCNLTGDLPECRYDRIISTVCVPTVPTVPASWLEALAPDGRLVTTLADTGLVIVAAKTPDGGAVGHVALEAAGFMSARHGEDYDGSFPENPPVWQTAQHADGESITAGRYPRTCVPDTWDVPLLPRTPHSTFNGLAHREETSIAQEIAKAAPASASVVKAFNTVFRQVLEKGRPDVFIAGDNAQAKTSVEAFVESLGMRPLDVGGLKMAHWLEGAGVVTVGLANHGVGNLNFALSITELPV